MNKTIKSFLITALLLTLLVGCTKDRSSELSEEQKERFFEIDQIAKTELIVPATMAVQLKLSGDQVVEDIKVVKGEARLVEALSGVTTSLVKGEQYKIQFAVTKSNLVVFKVLYPKQFNGLSDHEKSFAELKKDGYYWVPIVQYRIARFGKLEPVKNELGEATGQLEIKECNRAEATYIDVSLKDANRIPLGKMSRDEQTSYFSVAELNGRKVTIQLSDLTPGGRDVAATKLTRALYNANLARKVVARSKSDLRFERMFEDLWLSHIESQKVDVYFQLDQNYLTAYTLVDPADLDYPHNYPQTTQNGKAEIIYPLFQYPVSHYGQMKLGRSVEDDDYTPSVEIKETVWEQATTVVVNTFKQHRQMVGLMGLEDKTRKQLYSTKQLDGKMMTGKELHALLGVSVDADKKYRLVIGEDDQLAIFEIIPQTELLDGQVEVMAQCMNQGAACSVMPCTTEIANSAGLKSASECAQVKRYRYAINYVTLKRQTDSENRAAGWKVQIEPTTDPKSGLITIPEQVPDITYTSDLEREVMSGKRYLKISQFANQEFLFRRVMMDAPNAFEYAYTGSTGKLIIVKFDFKSDRVDIVRSDILLKRPGHNELDREVIMSIPVTYYKMSKSDASGRKRSNLTLVETTFDDGAAFAVVHWNKNRLPATHSPISYYGLEGCFAGQAGQNVEDVTWDPITQTYGFSLDTLYAINTNEACTVYGYDFHNYMKHRQFTYRFKERVSFMKYHPRRTGEDEYTPVQNLSYEIQKKLHFGFFTLERAKYDKYGEASTVADMDNMLTLFDLSDKNFTVNYVLAGIPSKQQNPILRDKVIRATMEVVGDVNSAFHTAFKGTPAERPADARFVALAVEGLDAEELEKYHLDPVLPKRLGDLDRNYLYYVQKRSGAGLLGLGGSNANPRNGKIEAGNVYIYGGNIWGQVSYAKKVAEVEREYEQMKKDAEKLEPLVTAATPKKSDRRPSSLGGPTFLDDVVMVEESTPSSVPGTSTAKSGMLRAAKHFKHQWEGLEIDERVKNSMQLFEKLTQNGDYLNERIVEAHLNPKLKHQIYTERVAAEMNKDFCVYADSSAQLSSMAMKIKPGMSDEDIFISEYKPTLAHEMLHNFGLRHNFMASVNSLKFGATGAKYTSVMDYQAANYVGLGTQDLYALRAGYTGLVQVNLGLLKAPLDRGGFTESVLQKFVAGQFIKIEEIPDILTHWKRGKDVTADEKSEEKPIDRMKALGALPNSELNLAMTAVNEKTEYHLLMEYYFCSDEDVPYNLLCRRFDDGPTMQAILLNKINAYKALYQYRNLRGDRYSFNDQWYQGSLISSLLEMREFLEEYFFCKHKQCNEDNIKKAATMLYHFLIELVTAPEGPGELISSNPSARFVTFKTPKGKKVVTELKPHDDVLLNPSGSDEANLIGIAVDKIFALQLLTGSNFSYARRIDYGDMETSFFHFETMALGLKDVSKSPIIQILSEILSDSLRVRILDPESNTIQRIEKGLYARSDYMSRGYVRYAPFSIMDYSEVAPDYNPAKFFRVVSGQTVPEGKLFFSDDPGSKDALKYWALDGATVIENQIRMIQSLDAIGTVPPALIEVFQHYFIAKENVVTYQAELDRTTDPEARKPIENKIASVQETLDQDKIKYAELILQLPEAERRDIDQLYDLAQKLIRQDSTNLVFLPQNVERVILQEGNLGLIVFMLGCVITYNCKDINETVKTIHGFSGQMKNNLRYMAKYFRRYSPQYFQ